MVNCFVDRETHQMQNPASFFKKQKIAVHVGFLSSFYVVVNNTQILIFHLKQKKAT